MPFNIQGPELILILIIALIVIGPGKLPDVGAALGKSIREFRKASTDVKDATRLDAPAPAAANAVPAPAAPTTAATTVPGVPPAPAPAVPMDPDPEPIPATAGSVSSDPSADRPA